MSTRWGQWHQGEIYDVRVGEVLWYNQEESRGRAEVQIRDKVSGLIFDRVGEVKIVGNFSPTWVNFRGNRLQLEEILRAGRQITGPLPPDRTLVEIVATRPPPEEWLPRHGKRG